MLEYVSSVWVKDYQERPYEDDPVDSKPLAPPDSPVLGILVIPFLKILYKLIVFLFLYGDDHSPDIDEDELVLYWLVVLVIALHN